ncbi:MAG: hypothetical protein ACM34B_04895 [Nitrospira sp.]
MFLTHPLPRRTETRRFPKPDLWTCYNALPVPIREQADKAFALLKKNPQHPSLHLKKVGRFWSARVGLHYRVVGVEVPDGVLWFWIGTHAEYDKLIR